MPGRVDGKVAFVSGAARGQGRSHAVRLAEEGASIIAFDLCRQIDTVAYPMSSPADLKEMTRLVEAVGGRILAREADARDVAAVAAVLEEGVAEFGRLDLVIANHGTMNFIGP